MRIGILTQPLHHNYGGLLQNYALQQSLIALGHVPITIDWTASSSWYRQLLKRLKNHVLSRKTTYELTENEKKYIYKKTDTFIGKYISRTDIVTSSSGFSQMALKYHFDAFIVGSDQTWRPQYNPYLYEMFLSFTESQDVKRIAYAASFGTDKWEFKNRQLLRCKDLIRRFDAVSVREISGVNLCRRFGQDAEFVLDPTLLLSKDDYTKIIKDTKFSHQQSGLLYYILNTEFTSLENIKKIADENHLDCYSALPEFADGSRTEHDVKNHLADCVYPSVEEWLYAIQNASVVITDSFHGMVFSIIFHKKFWVINNKGRGSARFCSLLGLLGLNHRMVDSVSCLKDNKIMEDIDWSNADSILSCEKERSFQFLKESLS